MRHLLFAFFVLALGLFASCGNSNTSAESEATDTEATTVVEEGINATDMETMEVDSAGPEFTSAYICPMHCKGSGSDAPGACPVCGMDYVANTNHPMHQGEEEGEEEDDSHEGHNH